MKTMSMRRERLRPSRRVACCVWRKTCDRAVQCSTYDILRTSMASPRSNSRGSTRLLEALFLTGSSWGFRDPLLRDDRPYPAYSFLLALRFLDSGIGISALAAVLLSETLAAFLR